jgi:hypothetical protein
MRGLRIVNSHQTEIFVPFSRSPLNPTALRDRGECENVGNGNGKGKERAEALVSPRVSPRERKGVQPSRYTDNKFPKKGGRESGTKEEGEPAEPAEPTEPAASAEPAEPKEPMLASPRNSMKAERKKEPPPPEKGEERDEQDSEISGPLQRYVLLCRRVRTSERVVLGACPGVETRSPKLGALNRTVDVDTGMKEKGNGRGGDRESPTRVQEKELRATRSAEKLPSRQAEGGGQSEAGLEGGIEGGAGRGSARKAGGKGDSAGAANEWRQPGEQAEEGVKIGCENPGTDGVKSPGRTVSTRARPRREESGKGGHVAPSSEGNRAPAGGGRQSGGKRKRGGQPDDVTSASRKYRRGESVRLVDEGSPGASEGVRDLTIDLEGVAARVSGDWDDVSRRGSDVGSASQKGAGAAKGSAGKSPGSKSGARGKGLQLGGAELAQKEIEKTRGRRKSSEGGGGEGDKSTRSEGSPKADGPKLLTRSAATSVRKSAEEKEQEPKTPLKRRKVGGKSEGHKGSGGVRAGMERAGGEEPGNSEEVPRKSPRLSIGPEALPSPKDAQGSANRLLRRPIEKGKAMTGRATNEENVSETPPEKAGKVAGSSKEF